MRPAFLSFLTGRVAVCSLLGLLVFFSRAWLVREWGSPLPYADQWDAEAIALYPHWVDGTLRWRDLIAGHNEHRILLTRLADLALFVWYDGWNPWAQLVLNSALHALTAGMLGSIFWPALSDRSRGFFIASLAVIFVTIGGWQNALYGFQSQVYFANVFAVGAIVGLAAWAPLRLGWWLGLAAAVLAFFSNAGGILALFSAVIVCLPTNLNQARQRTLWFGLALMVSTAAILFLAGAETPQHAPLHAQTTYQFVAVLSRCLAWPWINLPAACLVMQLPLAWLLTSRWRRREKLNLAERLALALVIFAGLQAAAIAYSRGAALSGFRPVSRYHDPLLLGVAGQLFAIVQLLSRGSRLGRLGALVWCGVLVAGLVGMTETNFALNLRFKQLEDRTNLAIVRDYAASQDLSVFSRDPYFSGPHPDRGTLSKVVNQPALRANLPAEIFGTPYNPLRHQPGIIQQAPVYTALVGAVLLGMITLLSRPRSQPSHTTNPSPRARP